MSLLLKSYKQIAHFTTILVSLSAFLSKKRERFLTKQI